MTKRFPHPEEQMLMTILMNAIDHSLDTFQMPLAVKISLLGSLLVTKLADMSMIDHQVAVTTATAHAALLSAMAATETHEQLALVLQVQHQEMTGAVREQ